MFDIFTAVINAWRSRIPALRITVVLCGVLPVLALLALWAANLNVLHEEIGGLFAGALSLATGALAATLTAWQKLQETRRRQARVERVEKKALEHPDEPKLAWDVARTKLENYLDRNLSQLSSIFWLTALVMVASFGLILYGLWHAFSDPQALPVAVVASTSGVMVSLVGGSFLLVYRSILAQSRGYVSVLERINAVGMAVQVLGSITDDERKLRNESTATLASQLIQLYGTQRSDEAPK